MNILTIILAVVSIALAIALYFQMHASKAQSEEGSKLLNDYKTRVEEQEQLQSDYRDLEKNFDNIGEGYEQALLMFDKLEEENRKTEATNQRLQEQNNELQKTNTLMKEQQQKSAEMLDQVIDGMRKELSNVFQAGGIADRKSVARMSRLASKVAGISIPEKGDEAVIKAEDNVMPQQIADLAVEQSGIKDVNYLKFDLQVTPSAASMMVLTNLQEAANALTELLDNAMKFTSDGSVKLLVTTDVNSTLLIFNVEDTGTGIPADEAEHVFEKGVRLNSFFDGAGMGLAIARTIARRMRGDLVIDQTYSGGTRFTMTLPI